MFITDMIKTMWYSRQLIKFEEKELLRNRSKIEDLRNWFKYKFETKKARAERLTREEEERKQFLNESNKRLAVLLRDENNINFICDFIKKHEFIDDYK